MLSIYYGKKMKKVYKKEHYFYQMALRSLRDDERVLREYKDEITNPDSELIVKEEFVENIQLFSRPNDTNLYDESKKVEYNGEEYSIDRVVVNPQNKTVKYYISYKTYIEDDQSKLDLMNKIRSEAAERIYKYAEGKREMFEKLPSSNGYEKWIWADEKLKKGQAVEILNDATDEKFNAVVSEVSKRCIYLVTYGGFRKHEVRKIPFGNNTRDIKFKILN